MGSLLNFIFENFIPLINSFEERTGLDVRISGMPYIRTLNAQNIVDEIGIFVISAMLVTTIIFFLFFRSFRATFILDPEGIIQSVSCNELDTGRSADEILRTVQALKSGGLTGCGWESGEEFVA